MEIETTRDIARQILRHRSFSFQEFSQRYADPTKDMGFVHREARLQDTKNRQNSIEISEKDDPFLELDWQKMQATLLEVVDDTYNWAINNGIAKEQARAVLPEGLTQSRMYMNGTLRSWIHYCELRMGVETQKEHRDIATMAWEEIIKIFPSLKDALDLGEK
jgi:thymidylate synthase (FAD)